MTDRTAEPQPLAAELDRTAADLAAALDDARKQALDGAWIDLSGLEDRVGRLCAAAQALPQAEARTLLDRLGDLVAALDPLVAALADQHGRRADILEAAIAGRDDPHTARQRAAAAYPRPPGALPPEST